MKEFIKRVLAVYRPFKTAVFIVFLCMILAQGLILVSPYIYGKIIDGLIAKSAMFDVLLMAVLAFLAYTAQNVALRYWQEYVEIQKINFDVSRHVSEATLARLLNFSVGQLKNENSGIKQSIINEGEHSLATLAYMLIYEVLPIFIQVVLTVVVLMFLSFSLGLIVLIGALVFAAITIHINLNMRDELKQYIDMSHEHSKMHTEILRNTELVQLNAQEIRVAKEYDGKFEKLNIFGKNMWTKFIFWANLRNLLTAFVRLLVMVVGIYYVYNGFYTAGDFVVFLMWSGAAFANLGMLGPIQRRLMQLYASVKKYFTMLDVEPDIKIVKNPIRPERFKGRIEFKNVTFKYPVRTYLDDDEIKEPVAEQESDTISDVSFTILPGQRVAFVGHSGAGKSTIVQLLLRAYDPDKGQIAIDGNDLRVLDLKTYRESVGYVEQSVCLFDHTLKYNIAFGLNGRSPDVTDDELGEVARLSCLDQFSVKLEKGFDTIIGEKGIRLSGGERQRVGIAHALIKDPQFLIFDEATSNLDTENESIIRKSIEEASEGRTTIIIAHRLSTVRDADNIFVMDGGRIVASGTHEELMENSQCYQRLVTPQILTRTF